MSKQYPTLAEIKAVADDRIEVWNDTECMCYRADPIEGFTVEDLHGLVAVYGDYSAAEMREARKDLMDRLEDAEVAPCDPTNENCQSSGCFAVCEIDGCNEKAEELNPKYKRCPEHFTDSHKRWLAGRGYTY